MDVTVPVMVDSELAAEMVQLLGEELKKTRGKLRAAEQELEKTRNAQRLPVVRGCEGQGEGCCSKMLVRLHQVFNVSDGKYSAGGMLLHAASELRWRREELEAERAHTGEVADRAKTLETQLAQFVQEKEQVVGEKQHIIAHLTETMTELESRVAELREALRARDGELGEKAKMLAAPKDTPSEHEKKLRVYEDAFKKKQRIIAHLSEAKTRLEGEVTELNETVQDREKKLELQLQVINGLLHEKENQARAAKSRVSNVARARNEIKVLKVERNELKESNEMLEAHIEKCKAEAEKLKAEALKFKAEAEQRAEAGKARQIMSKQTWAEKYGNFVKIMLDLPEPADPLPIRDKARPCLDTRCLGATPAVAEAICQLYKSHAILYLPDLPLWRESSSNGVSVMHVYNYNASASPPTSRWTRNTLRNKVNGQVRELFYREGDVVFYARTFKFIKGPELVGVQNLGDLRAKEGTPKRLARRTLETSERNDALFSAVESAYATGVLPVALIGLQCIGYKAGFDERLRAQYMPNLTKPSGVDATLLSNSVKSEPESTPNARVLEKRKRETAAAADPRKKAKTGATSAATKAVKPGVKVETKPPAAVNQSEVADSAARIRGRE